MTLLIGGGRFNAIRPWLFANGVHFAEWGGSGRRAPYMAVWFTRAQSAAFNKEFPPLGG